MKKGKQLTESKWCPECGKNKIYLSQAQVFVCSACGTIFKPLSSDEHLIIARYIKKLEKQRERCIEHLSNMVDALED